MSGEFMKLKCKCKNQQVIFSKPSSVVKCLVCGEVLAEPTGGKARVRKMTENAGCIGVSDWGRHAPADCVSSRTGVSVGGPRRRPAAL